MTASSRVDVEVGGEGGSRATGTRGGRNPPRRAFHAQAVRAFRRRRPSRRAFSRRSPGGRPPER